jgi:glycosyltransferase involved in cell wall biosynthesis
MQTMQILTVLTGFFFLALAWRTLAFSNGLDVLEKQPDELPTPPTGRSVHAKSSRKWPKLSIVIPACNEAQTIEAAALSLLEVDYPCFEVVFVNDRSTDGTGEIIDRLAALDPHFKAIHIHTLPPGWLGKVYAMSQGVAATDGTWVLMTDADVHFSPQSLKKAVAYAIRRHLDFLTVIPDLVTPTFGLQVMMAQLYHQASLFFNPRKLNDPKQRICYGQGAFLLFDRATYERTPGLEWLKMEVIDDAGFALLMRRAGARMGALAGRNEIRLEWYSSLSSMLKGLEKNGFAMCQYSFATIGCFILCTWLIFLGFTLFPVLTWSWSYMGFSLACLFTYLICIDLQLQKLMQMSRLSVFLFPLTFVLLPFIYLRAAVLATRRKGIDWRGTFYSLQDLKANQRMKLVNLVFTGLPVEFKEAANS